MEERTNQEKKRRGGGGGDLLQAVTLTSVCSGDLPARIQIYNIYVCI